MRNGIQTELKIPDLWYDFYARILPGGAFVAAMRLLIFQKPALPGILEIVLLAFTGYFCALIINSLASRIARRIKPRLATVLAGAGLIVLSACQAPVSREPTPSREPIHFIDVHVHYSPIGEECPPKSKHARKKGWTGMTTKEFIASLEKYGIDKVILSAPPTAILLGSSHSDFCIPQLSQHYPGRIFVMYGGEAFTLLHKVVIQGEYTEKQTKRFKKMLIEAMDSRKYVGFGEIGLNHLMIIKRKGTAARIPANHPWMLLLSDIASQYNVPIDNHMSSTRETVSELEELLAHNRNTKIILAHAGWSDIGTETPEFWKRLLSKHPNLYSSIKHRKIGSGFSDPRVGLRDENGEMDPEWLKLFEQFPNRFMIGSDIKPGARKRKGSDFRHIPYMQEFLYRLPPNLREKFTIHNANQIFNLSKHDGT